MRSSIGSSIPYAGRAVQLTRLEREDLMASFAGIAPVLGAEVTGVDLRRLGDSEMELLRRRC